MVPEALSILPRLANEIRSSHDACLKTGNRALEYARQAGQKLEEAKAHVAHGGWQAWVTDNCGFAVRTAQRYMQIAEKWPQIEQAQKASRGTLLALRDARELIAVKSDIRADDRPGSLRDELTIDQRRELCSTWWDQLAKFAVLLDAAGYSTTEAAEHVGMSERDVRLILEPEFPVRFDTPENGSLIPADVQRAYADQLDQYAANWMWNAYTNACFYCERYTTFGDGVAAEMRAMARHHERRYRRLSKRYLSEGSAFWDTDYALGLHWAVGDDARTAYGIESGPPKPLLEIFAKAEEAAASLAVA